MGEAYRLRDGRVLKILREELAQDAEIRERFETEIRLQMEVRSPFVPTVHVKGVRDGRPYFVMGHCPGVVLARCLEDGRSLPKAEVGSELLDALSHCHTAGVVHRDLKADNVVVAGTQSAAGVSLIDFGVACMPIAGVRSKIQFGSPCAWGPERLLGFDGADVRSDLFSAGILLYMLIAGVHPFAHATPSSREQLGLCEVPPLRAFALDAPPLDAFFRQALAKELNERFQSASLMRVAWQEACLAASNV